MKKSLTLLFLFSLILSKNLSAQTCSASFYFRTESSNYLQQNFTNLSSKSTTTKYLWNFGDGSTSKLMNPSHKFANYKNYNVCLIVNDTLTNCRDTFCDMVYYCDSRFWSRGYGNYIEVYAYSSNKSRLDFGDGTASANSQGIHVYKNPGVFNICLTTYCSAKDSSTTCVKFDKTCRGVIDYTFDPGNKLKTTFSNKGTANSTAKYFWNFGDGNYSTLANPTHTYSKDGYYNVALDINDSVTYCRDSVGLNITVGSPPCDTSFYHYITGDNLYFRTETYKAKIKWDFGDGKISTEQSGYHMYDKVGTYNLCMSYTCHTKDSFKICHSIGVKCKALFTKSLDTTQKFKVIVTNKSSKGGRYRYWWYFGDRTASVPDRNPTHKYTAFGKYRVCLTVIDDSTSCTSDFCDTIGLDSNGKLLKANLWEIAVKEEKEAEVGIENLSKPNFKIYPNPANEKISIELSNSNIHYDKLEIINNQGQVCFSQPIVISNQNIEVNIANLKSGLYLIKLSNNSDYSYSKMIKDNN